MNEELQKIYQDRYKQNYSFCKLHKRLTIFIDGKCMYENEHTNKKIIFHELEILQAKRQIELMNACIHYHQKQITKLKAGLLKGA